MHKPCAGCGHDRCGRLKWSWNLEVKTDRLFFHLKTFVMKKLSFGLPVLALVMAVAASAFTAKPVSGTQWHFMSSSATDIRNSQAYEQNANPTDCDFGNLPCVIEVPHVGSNTALQDLQAYLNSKTAEQIVAEALETKD